MEPITPETLVGLLGRWAAGRGPLYRLLATRLRALIEEGALAPDGTLPPDRVLATHLAVGRGTVVAAYDLLRDEGRLVRRQGSGTRVAPRAPTVREDAGADGPARAPWPAGANPGTNPLFVSLFEPNPGALVLTCAAPEAPPPEVREALRRASGRLHVAANDIGYHPMGHPELREAVAARFRARGLPTDPAEVLVTAGAQQALSLVVRCLVAPGDTVLAERPTYPGALALFGEAAAVTRTVPVGAEGLDTEACGRALAEHRPALTYLVPSFHNPTGTVLSPLRRRRVVAAAAEHGTQLVEDETLAELGFAGEVPPPLASYPGGEGVITVGSLSKLVWGGLRVGWVRAPRPVIDRLARLRTITDLGGDVAGQLAACHLLEALESVRQRRRAELSARHAHLCGLLDRWLPDWEYGRASGGQTLWVRLPRGDAASFAQVALRHGVAVLPGDALAPAEEGSDRVRLPFLAPEGTLTTAVRRLAAAWSAYGESAERRAEASPLNAMVV